MRNLLAIIIAFGAACPVNAQGPHPLNNWAIRQNEIDACNRKGGVWRGSECQFSSPGESRSSVPAVSPIYVANHCPQPMRVLFGVSYPGIDRVNTIGWINLPARPRCNGFWDCMASSPARTEVFAEGRRVMHDNKFELYLYAESVSGPRVVLGGDKVNLRTPTEGPFKSRYAGELDISTGNWLIDLRC